MLENDLKSVLSDLPISALHFFKEIESTNSFGLQRLSGTSEDLELIIAANQTAGRGRFDRTWLSKPNSSLTFSLILHPTVEEVERLALFSPLGALALSETISNFCGIEAKIKWPNDVLLNGRKTAGILTEAHWQDGFLSGIVLGIGINLFQESVPPDDKVLYPATCVQEHCEKKIQPVAFLKELISKLIYWRQMLAEPEFIRNYQMRLAFLGQSVIIQETITNSKSGILLGINHLGQLQLATEIEGIIEVSVGDLRLRPAE